MNVCQKTMLGMPGLRTDRIRARGVFKKSVVSQPAAGNVSGVPTAAGRRVIAITTVRAATRFADGRRMPITGNTTGETHAAYAERNRAKTRERLRCRRAMFAKQNAIRKNAVGYLQGLRTGAWFAKQNAMSRPVDGILIFLTLREVFAKQSPIALTGAVVELSHP